MAHTLTVYASTADDEVASSSSTYTTAADGGGTLAIRGATEAAQIVGQQKPGDYYCHEAFESFDTSSLADSGITITDVDLSIYVAWNPTETAWTLQARAFDWGASVATGDFRTRAQLSALTLLASLGSASLGAGAYRALTSEEDFLEAIDTDGTTYVVLCSSRHVAGNAPSNYELLSYQTADTAGTTQDPKLVITYTVQNTAELSTTSPATGGVTRSTSLVRLTGPRSQAYLKQQRDFYRVAMISDTHFCHDTARRTNYGMGVNSGQNVTATATRDPDAWHHLGDIIDFMPSEWNEAEDCLDGLNLYACLGTHDYDLYKYPEVSTVGMPSDLWEEVALTLASGVSAGNNTITVSEAVTGVVAGHTALLISDPEADGYTPQSNFEVLTVDSVNVGAKTITFTSNLTNSYSTGDHFRQGYGNQRGIDYMLSALSNTPMNETRKFYTVGNLLFVFLSVDRWHPAEEGFSRNLWAANDLQWLESVIAAGDAANYNIFVHTHMAPSAETGTNDWEPSIVYWPAYVQTWFKRLCASYTIALWSSGHTHTSQLEADGLTSLTNGVTGWGDTYFWVAPALFQMYSDYKYQTSYLDFHDGSSTAVLTNWAIDGDGDIAASPFRTRNITLPYEADLTSRGAVTTFFDGAYTVHVFTTSGTLLCPDGFSRNAEVLIAGGGGGGAQGGGGGGGYQTEDPITITGNMPVVVGEGGFGGIFTCGAPGGISSFAGVSVEGGGGGGFAGNGNPGANGGGSGLGSRTCYGGDGSPGFDGGGNAGYTGAPYPAGGGGGATAIGGDATSNSAAGAGGAGAANDISGASAGYCGGGGGGVYGDGTPGTASDGGGAGGDSVAAPTAGTDGTGGGGGGGTNDTGGARGGDGSVIIRYLTPVVTDQELPAVPVAIAGITRSIGATRSTTASSVPALTRAVSRAFAAVSSAVATVLAVKPIVVILEAVSSATASLQRTIGKVAAGTASAVATRQIAVARSLSAVSSASGTIARAISKVLSVVAPATPDVAMILHVIVRPLKSGMAFIKNISGVAAIRAVVGVATKKNLSGEVNIR